MAKKTKTTNTAEQLKELSDRIEFQHERLTKEDMKVLLTFSDAFNTDVYVTSVAGKRVGKTFMGDPNTEGVIVVIEAGLF